MEERINEAIFDFIYHESLNDATTRTGAVRKRYEDAVNGKDAKSAKDYVSECKKIKDCVKKYAEAVINGTVADYSFEMCVEDIEKTINNNQNLQGFTFGNIQKLINMTMKYLYVRYYDKYRARFSKCHAPMDSTMKNKVYVYIKKQNCSDKPNLFYRDCAWSKMNEGGKGIYSKENYYKYQDAVNWIIKHQNMECSPIEFDLLFFRKNIDETVRKNNE